MIVRVGSANPVKLRATRSAFRMFFPRVRIVPTEVVGSGIPATWKGILRGARERARRSVKGADLGVGIEAGTVRLGGATVLVTLACVTDGRRFAVGGSPFFAVPDLGMLRRAGETGAIGTMTGGKITREELTRWAVAMALAFWIAGPRSGR